MPPKFEFQPQTKISVHGTSTLHDYECQAASVVGALELPSADAENVRQMFGSLQGVSVTVPVAKIDCGNGTMDKKLREALKAGKAPLIKYTMANATVAGDADAKGFYTLKTSGKLSIAGSEKSIEMDVRGMQMPDGKLHFTGSKKIKMSDWGVDAPSAMFGAVKAGDEVTVKFEVIAAN